MPAEAVTICSAARGALDEERLLLLEGDAAEVLCGEGGLECCPADVAGDVLVAGFFE